MQSLTIGMRVKRRTEWAPLDPDKIIGTIVAISPAGAVVYVRMRDGSVERWRAYQVEVVE